MDNEFLREVQRNGEIYLEGQLKIALAADQRAVALGGIMATASSIVLGFGIAHDLPTCFVISLGLIIASIFAFTAIRPVKFPIAGYDPDDWVEDISNGASLDDRVYNEIFAHLHSRIAKNNLTLEKNARYLNYSIMTLILTVLLGVVLGGLAYQAVP